MVMIEYSCAEDEAEIEMILAILLKLMLPVARRDRPMMVSK